jgi:hypothetical protein
MVSNATNNRETSVDHTVRIANTSTLKNLGCEEGEEEEGEKGN